MPTISQLVRQGREAVLAKTRVRRSREPAKARVGCVRVFTQTTKKRTRAAKGCARAVDQRDRGDDLYSRRRHNLQEHSLVLTAAAV